MTTPAACFPVRTAVIALRTRGNYSSTNYTVAFPEEWTKKQLLDYVRAVHPNETAKIVQWNESRSAKDKPRLWLANPRAFVNFKKGEMKAVK